MHTYFQNLLELLEVERRADLESYNKIVQSSPVAERRAAGLTWYPIAIRNTELTRGDYLSVEVERTTHHDLSHQLRFGASAVLFSNHDPANNRVEGVISFQVGNRLKLNLRTDELPDWADEGKLGIELLFDNNSYQEMISAIKASDKLLTHLKDGTLLRVLIGEETPVFQQSSESSTNAKLNESQNESLEKILSAKHLAVVHGPPGTGKTTTLVQAIKTLVREGNEKVLVVAPSNAAVDLLSQKLDDEGLNVLRIGNPARVSEKLLALTMDNKIAAHADFKQIRDLKKQANEFRNIAHKYKRNFGKSEREQRKALFAEAHKIIQEAGKVEQFIQDSIVNKAEVITATLVGANHYSVKNLNYNTVVIDEAGQSLEAACLIPILKAEKVVLAGDPYQLPPTIKSDEAARKGLNVTLLEKCITRHPDAVVLLKEQYRMNTEIMGFSSREFYSGLLKSHHSVANRRLFPEDEPLLFIDTAGCGFDEKLEGTSTTNPDEAALLASHLAGLVNDLTNKGIDKPFPNIAIISPYKEQVKIVEQAISEFSEIQAHKFRITVNTVDSFQGQERDVVYISLTRSNPEGSIGFLADIRRMNVAMTRARKKLVVFGDSATLSRLKFYQDFIKYAEDVGGYKSAWEFIEQ